VDTSSNFNRGFEQAGGRYGTVHQVIIPYFEGVADTISSGKPKGLATILPIVAVEMMDDAGELAAGSIPFCT
jgi:hypothetical protein